MRLLVRHLFNRQKLHAIRGFAFAFGFVFSFAALASGFAFAFMSRTNLVALIRTSVDDGDPYDFNPSSVSRYDLSFGPGQASATGNGLNADVDGDGDTDKIYAFEMQASGIACGDTEVELTSELSGYPGDVDIPLIGTASIQTEDCTVGCHP